LKGAVPRNNAMDYVRNGSMNVTVARDLFLYKTVTFVVRQSSSSGSRSGGSHTHTSSSGRTHGGGGGHF
ncbi:MAG: TPM domain-containing protein, partial [Clostridia bacterium]|nr:TPM domain-containing protein [Clostridia bacterium]